MSQEPRKATDVLLDIDAKLDKLISMVSAQDLNIKILSNKYNEIMAAVKQQPQKITVEAIQTPTSQTAFTGRMPNVDPERAVVVTAESKLQVDDTPQGFRRTSRPESYSGADNSYLKQNNVAPTYSNTPLPTDMSKAPPGRNTGEKVAKPPPGRTAGETVVVQTPPKTKEPSPPATKKVATETNVHGIVPVEQRVVDRNGKSIFLAEVEITDVATNEAVSKSRTGATGKWMAALPLGNYKVIIRKLESLTREKVESIQTIKVDGSESPLRLPMVIIK